MDLYSDEIIYGVDSSDPPVFIKRASDNLEQRINIENELLIAQNLLLSDSANLVADSFYWIAAKKGSQITIVKDDLRTVMQPELEFQTTRGPGVAISFPRGAYALSLYEGANVVRTVFLFAKPSRRSTETQKLPSLNYVVLVPRESMLLEQLGETLCRVNFRLVDELPMQRSKQLFCYQTNLSLNVLIVPYGDLDSALTLDNDVKFANEVLLLLNDDKILPHIALLSGVFSSLGKVMDFTTKNDSVTTQLVELSTLPAIVQIIISKLRRLQSPEISIGAAMYRPPKQNEKDVFESFIARWLMPNAPFNEKVVYLRFSYKTGPLLTLNMAQQFTKDILDRPLESTIHCVKQQNEITYVYASCTVLCLWLLNMKYDRISEQTPATEIQELFLADIEVAAHDPELNSLRAEMKAKGVLTTSDQRFFCPRKRVKDALCEVFMH